MTRITLKNVRIAYPHLFTKNSFQGQETGYDSLFLIPKSDNEQFVKIKSLIEQLQVNLKAKVPHDKVCFKDGDLQEKDYSKGHWVLKSSSKKDKPVVLDAFKKECDEQNSPIYNGCFVNASLDFWLQDNQYGKRINSNLYAVMFAGDGEPIGSNKPSKQQVYSDFDDVVTEEFDIF